jgi:hypothetical protein
MTLIVFIYVYYRLFACTNLVDVMSLFSRFFRSIYQFSTKIGWFPAKPARKLPRRFSEKSADLLVFPVFTDFYRFFQKLTGSVTSNFRSSAEFSNTASGMTFFQNQCFLQSSTISSIGTPFVSDKEDGHDGDPVGEEEEVAKLEGAEQCHEHHSLAEMYKKGYDLN